MAPAEARAVPHHLCVHVRWAASRWLLVPVPFLAAPAVALWTAAALQVVGAGQPLDAMVAALAPLGRLEPAFGLVLLFGLPAIAFALAFFAFFGGELGVADWTIDARLRLPRPPWSAIDVIAALLLLFTALLALAVAAHGVAG
ncbi:MAG TPA: hypothetical protein VF001_09320 [Candidatus Limnocylindria bacterium]